MLYGVEAAGAVPAESAAEGVMARVQAYREIKGQIERRASAMEVAPMLPIIHLST